MSSFLEIILKSLTKDIKNNIKDNIEFLKTCKQNFTDDTALVSFDVCYTIHQYPTLLIAIKYSVSNYKQNINLRFIKQFIEVASFTFSNNSITFDEMFYLQIQGTATETISASVCTKLSIGYH